MMHDSLELTVLDEAELLRILTRFYRHLDANDIASLCGQMDADFRWRRQGLEPRSPADIATALTHRDPRLHIFHLLTSVTFAAAAEGRVAYSGYLTVVRSLADADQATRMPPRGAQSLHVCEGEFRRGSDGWRICAMDAGPPRLFVDIPGGS